MLFVVMFAYSVLVVVIWCCYCVYWYCCCVGLFVCLVRGCGVWFYLVVVGCCSGGFAFWVSCYWWAGCLRCFWCLGLRCDFGFGRLVLACAVVGVLFGGCFGRTAGCWLVLGLGCAGVVPSLCFGFSAGGFGVLWWFLVVVVWWGFVRILLVWFVPSHALGLLQGWWWWYFLLVCWLLGFWVDCGDLWTARSCGLFRLVVVSECWFWWGVSGDLVGSAMRVNLVIWVFAWLG